MDGSEVACQLKTDHREQIVFVHEDGWRPKEKNQYVQKVERVVTLVLSGIRVSFPKNG